MKKLFSCLMCLMVIAGSAIAEEPQTSAIASCGEQVAITITVNTGYELVSLSDGVTTISKGDARLVTTDDVHYTYKYVPVVNASWKAKFEKKKYTIKFVDEDGTTVMKTVIVNHGDRPSYGVEPTKVQDERYTYSFKEWSPNIVDATADATYKAVWTKTDRLYKVEFVDKDGATTTELQSDSKPYNSEAKYTGAEPSRAGYNFIGWESSDGTKYDKNDVLPNRTKDETYTALYEVKMPEYSVTIDVDPAWRYYGELWVDGEKLSATATRRWTAGDKHTLEAKVTDDCYEFAGWEDGTTDNPREYEVTATETVKATFRKKQYVVNVAVDGEAAQGAIEVQLLTPSGDSYPAEP